MDSQKSTLATLEDIKFEIKLRTHKNLVWKTKEGKEIPLKDLDDKHLFNIYKMLSKQEEDNFELEELKCEYSEWECKYI